MSTSHRAPAFLPIKIIRKAESCQIRMGPKAIMYIYFSDDPGIRERQHRLSESDAMMLATLVARTLRMVWEGH